MVGDPGEERAQGPPARLDEAVVEALHHALHHELLRQRLRQTDPRERGARSAVGAGGTAARAVLQATGTCLHSREDTLQVHTLSPNTTKRPRETVRTAKGARPVGLSGEHLTWELGGQGSVPHLGTGPGSGWGMQDAAGP